MDSEKNGSVNTVKTPGETPSRGFAFFVFLTLLTLLAWQVTRPLIGAIAWAAMLAFIVYPAFRRINRFLGGHWPGFSALLTLMLLFVVILVPAVMIFFSLGKEVAGLGAKAAAFIDKVNPSGVMDPTLLIPSWLPASVSEYLHKYLSNSASMAALSKDIAQWAASFLKVFSTKFVHGFASFTFLAAITMMAAFFFVRDGSSVMVYVKSITPLSSADKALFYGRAEAIFYSVVFGNLLTVLVQAVLGGIGWWFVGLNNPAFFGMLMFFAGMLPAGTAVVWLPGSLYLFLTGNAKGGIVLLIWGACLVGTIDNVLRPLLISSTGKGENISTLFIIIGICGGLSCWGLLGIFLGPLVLALFKLVFDISRVKWLETGQ